MFGQFCEMSTENCYNVVQKQVPVANARLVVRVMTKGNYVWSLKTISVIEAHDEILFNYGAAYKYPEVY